jgi:hypothetical protein
VGCTPSTLYALNDIARRPVLSKCASVSTLSC